MRAFSVNSAFTQGCKGNSVKSGKTFIRISYQTISELTFFMKVLHFSILNNILQHEINEKPCWTELFFI